MGDEVESNYAPRIKALGMSLPYSLKWGMSLPYSLKWGMSRPYSLMWGGGAKIGGSEFKPLKFEGSEIKIKRIGEYGVEMFVSMKGGEN